MKHTFEKQARRAGIALAAVAAFAALGPGTAQAQTFTSVDFSIAPRSNEAQEIEAGDLVCTWRETGLAPYAVIEYSCSAEAVAVVEACVYKNQIISATETSVFTDVTGQHDVALIAGRNGAINGSTATSPGHGGGGGGELCPHLEVNGPEPEVEVIAVRWCNASLTDTTNNILGGTAAELFLNEDPSIIVPTCAEILP
jgi:hypothetical protein